MTGTDKQITWATEIRNVSKINTMFDVAVSAAHESGKAAIETLRNQVLAVESASWWIDNRGLFFCNTHSGNVAEKKGDCKANVVALYKLLNK